MHLRLTDKTEINNF